MEFLSGIFRDLFSVFLSDEFAVFLHYLYVSSPIWVLILLALFFWHVWIQQIRAKFISNQKYMLLELKLPPEVQKSPLAMELVLSGLHQTGGERSWYKRYFQGSMRPWFSLEIASFEGSVHFYIWVSEGFKNLVESQFYGQYPNIEIIEVPDYTDIMPYYDKNRFRLWGCYFVLSKPDPYPIRTYVDYGLDRDPKEEFKIDPLTPIIEYMGLLGKGEYLWVQILFRAHVEKYTGWFSKITWQDEGRKIIKDIYEKMRPKVKDETKIVFPRAATKGEEEILKALERSISKLGFDVGIRTFYFSNYDDYKGFRIPGLVGMFKPFSAPGFGSQEDKVFGFNGFQVKNPTDFDYPWHDIKRMRENRNRRRIVDGYRRRSFFFGPYIRKPFVLNAEELATIYHPIGTTLQTPSVARVPSRKAEPPGNLPR